MTLLNSLIWIPYKYLPISFLSQEIQSNTFHDFHATSPPSNRHLQTTDSKQPPSNKNTEQTHTHRTTFTVSPEAITANAAVAFHRRKSGFSDCRRTNIYGGDTRGFPALTFPPQFNPLRAVNETSALRLIRTRRRHGGSCVCGSLIVFVGVGCLFFLGYVLFFFGRFDV